MVGIASNVLLAGFKASVGMLAGSIAITMDAINNLSDILSSVITIVGTKLAARPADAGHPFGHGRIEYFTAMIISIIVLIAGVTSLIESGKKILSPSTPTYSTATLVVIVTAILVKISLGRFVKRKGTELRCDSLVASGADALFDAVVTASTLLSAGIMLLFGINLDGVFGALISLIIIKAGISMLGSPVNQLLGKGVPRETFDMLHKEVMSYPQVHGVFDIILNYYGPNTIIGSLHINIDDNLSALEIHRLTRTITEDLLRKYHMIITVGIYVSYTHGEYAEIQKNVMAAVEKMEHVDSTHAFFYEKENNLVTLDVVHDATIRNDIAFSTEIANDLKQQFPSLNFNIFVDHNYLEQSE